MSLKTILTLFAAIIFIYQQLIKNYSTGIACIESALKALRYN